MSNLGRLLNAKTFLIDVADQSLSPKQGKLGIIVDVHWGCSNTDGLLIRISFGNLAHLNNLPRDHGLRDRQASPVGAMTLFVEELD